MNRYRPHLYVIPEDRRDEQIANGFVQHDSVDARRIQVMPPAGGWTKVLDTFRDEYISRLNQYVHTHVVLLIDFDGKHTERLRELQAKIPRENLDRVFIIGPQTTPEVMTQTLKCSYENVGRALAQDCASETISVWGHEQLKHNEVERVRLADVIKPFLFEST